MQACVAVCAGRPTAFVVYNDAAYAMRARRDIFVLARCHILPRCRREGRRSMGDDNNLMIHWASAQVPTDLDAYESHLS